MLFVRGRGRLSLVSLAVLAACSTPVVQPPPTPPPPVIPTIKPRPPMNAVEGMGVPEKGTDGKYLTPNRSVTSNTALWHVRMALNVAALNCDRFSAVTRTQYNQILAVHRVALDNANDAVDRNYAVAYGRSGVGLRERLNTVVYNFFALPPVTKSFCAVAATVGTKIAAMPSDALLGYAPEALAELERPFQEFYAAYADYLRRLAEWQSRFGGTVTVVVSPTPLPPPPIPPGDAPPAGGYMPSSGKALQNSLPPPPSSMTTTPAPASPAPISSTPAPAPVAPAPVAPRSVAPAPVVPAPTTAPAAPLVGPPAVSRTQPRPSSSAPTQAPAPTQGPTLTVQPLPVGQE